MSTTDIFDDIVDEMESRPTETDEPGEAPEVTEAPEATDNSAVTRLTLPVGERPEGSLTIPEFTTKVNNAVVAERMTHLMQEQGLSPQDAIAQALTAQVAAATFYQAAKAQRNPMPHYVVTYRIPVLDNDGNDTGDVKEDEKFFVDYDAAYEWWQNRPARGTGGAVKSEDDVQSLLVRAGRKFHSLGEAEKRLEKLQSNIAKMREQSDKYTARLDALGKTRDEALSAFEASEEAKESDKEISDNE